MKTITLSDEQFQLLGSLIGHCFCGDHPQLMNIYNVLREQNDSESFPEPPVDQTRNSGYPVYLQAPMVGRVISFNIASARNERLTRELVLVIKQHGGEVIDA